MTKHQLTICPALRDWDIWTVENGEVTLTVALCGGLLGGLLLMGLEDGAYTRRRRPIPPGRLCLDPAGRSAAASGRAWGILLHDGGDTRTLTATMEHFRPGETLEVHLVFADEGPMNCFKVSGGVKLGERDWDFPLSQSRATLERVRKGRVLD